jgi:acetyl-CoA acyltransferase
MSQVVVVDSIRTGLAKAHRGTFNLTRSDDLVAHCIDALLERNPAVDAAEIEDVILGCGRQVGEQSANVARHAVALSSLPVTVPATTISRACSSGLNSIAFAANQIASGCAQVAMAGGVESITGLERGTPAQFDENPRLLAEKPDIFMAMGNTAEVVARRYQVTRESQDEYALQSQQRYAAAVASGAIAEEIAPMMVNWRKVIDKETKETAIVEGTVDRDECNRPTTTIEGLAKLAPAFEDDGSVTAGNASQLSDGASMTLLMTEQRAEQLGLQPMGYFRGFTVAGCEPDEMGIGPVFAIPKLLEYTGLSLDEVDLVELNEAFASQCLYKKLGIVSMCIGKGMGAAGLFEAC